MGNYTQLTLKERETIFEMKQNGKKNVAIAKELKRHESTISRELRRNRYNDTIEYTPDKAQDMAKKRKYVLVRKLEKDKKLNDFMVEKLEMKWSPDVIAAESKKTMETTISTEAIYSYIYFKAENGLYFEAKKRSPLYLFLASSRSKRNQRGARKSRKTMIQNRVPIHDRSEAINKRIQVGDFEGDLLFGGGDQSQNIMNIFERKTRYMILIKNSSKKTNLVMVNIFKAMASIPKSMRKSITFDNGTEFTQHSLLHTFPGFKTYFCDPHSPWQKGQVEKGNAMIRRYLPKGSSISSLDANQLMDIQNKLNNTPRKILGYRTPAELFHESMELALRT